MELWKVIAIVAIVVAVAALIALAIVVARASRRPQLIDRDSLNTQSNSLTSSEHRFIDALAEAVIIVDRGGVVMFASDDAAQFALVKDGRLVQSDVLEILALTVADGKLREREIEVTSSSALSSDGRGVAAGQLQPSNTTYLLVRIGALGDDHYAVIVSDMSEQRRFEQLRDDYITDVSHELKTPAGAIALLAETVNDAADDPEAVRYFTGRISKESNRLTELVQHLIALQKSQGTGETHSIVDAASIARDAIEANRVQAADSNITVTLSVNGKQVHSDEQVSGPRVYANAESMTAAVKNLVENAIHYSPANTAVVVGVSEQAGKVTIRVVDQGIGIPADSLDRVFERFYRVDAARSRQTGGSGLGLAITRQCVEANGGTIAVWSREGEGSTFTIELPDTTDAEEKNTEEENS